MVSSLARKEVSPEDLAAQLEHFSTMHMPPERQHLVPTLRELRAAGFHALANSLRRCQDKPKVAEIMGKTFRLRGPLPGQKHRNMVQRQHASVGPSVHFREESRYRSGDYRGRPVLTCAVQPVKEQRVAVSPSYSSLPGNQSWERSGTSPLPHQPGMYRHAGCTHSARSVDWRCTCLPQARARAQAPQNLTRYSCIGWRTRWLHVRLHRRRQVQPMQCCSLVRAPVIV
jgi:hypothetical protein